jgi:hypothetical protein
MKLRLLLSLLVCVLAVGCQDHSIPEHILINFSGHKTRLYIEGESDVRKLEVTGGDIRKTLASSNGREVEIRGTGSLRYLHHNIEVQNATVRVDGKPLPDGSWILKSNGQVVEGFIRTFD